MKFNLAEQLAVLKSIDEVILADERVDLGEVMFVSRLSKVMNFNMDLIKKAREVEAKEALAILKAMPVNKKHALAVLLDEAANADGRVNEAEFQLIRGIFSEVGIV